MQSSQEAASPLLLQPQPMLLPHCRSVYATCVLLSFHLTSKPALHISARFNCSLLSFSQCLNSCSSICCNSYSKSRRKNTLNDAKAGSTHSTQPL